MMRKQNRSALLVALQTAAATMENSMGFPQKTKNGSLIFDSAMGLPFDSAIPLLGLYPKNPETPIQNNLYTPMFTAAVYNSQVLEAT